MDLLFYLSAIYCFGTLILITVVTIIELKKKINDLDN